MISAQQRWLSPHLLVLAIMFAVSLPAGARAISSPKIQYEFSGTPDGSAPYTGVTFDSKGRRFGVTSDGGIYNDGLIYELNADGTVRIIHSFDARSEGAAPRSELVVASDGYIYGTTQYGGGTDNGTVYKFRPNGHFETVYSFNGLSDGGFPAGDLVEGVDGKLYGTTYVGGQHENGTIYSVDSSGKLTTLYSIDPDSDGSFLLNGLARGSDGYLYGVTQYGGAHSGGTIFRIDYSGNFAVIHNLAIEYSTTRNRLSEGSDGFLYGATYSGKIYKVSKDGAFVALYSMSKSEGRGVLSGLFEADDGYFYGTAHSGGSSLTCLDCGTMFRISSSGAFQKLWNFEGSMRNPFARISQDARGRFWSTTNCQCTAGGTVFSFRRK